MKFSFVTFAMASATEQPTISMDFGQIHQHGRVGHLGLISTQHARQHHHLSSKQVNTAKVHVCTANNFNNNNQKNNGIDVRKGCALPIAKAYDHHDGALNVNTKVLLVRSEGKNNANVVAVPGSCVQTPSMTASCGAKFINYALRSEYIVKYDAKDRSGNDAEQVVFAVILQDHVKPVITVSSNKTFEALVGGQCKTNAAAWPSIAITDNIDTKFGSVVGPRQMAHIDTHTLGVRTGVYSAKDWAGVFGANGANNAANNVKVSVNVVDTTIPVITKLGGGAKRVQCASKYTDAGANLVDSHDSAVCGSCVKGYGKACTISTSVLRVKTANPVNNMKTGKYTVTYTGQDHSANQAITQTRSVTVFDTIKPVLKICTGGAHSWARNNNGQAENRQKNGKFDYNTAKNAHTKSHSGTISGKFSRVGNSCLDHHIIQHSAGYTRDLATIKHLESGTASAICTDTCFSKNCAQTRAVTTSWHTGSCNGAKAVFDTLKPASYFIKYSCTDCNKNTATKCRTIVNEDHTKPVLDILGNDKMTIEATYHKNYVDDGATCSDQVDDVISQEVEVSGDVVNLSKIGTYKITYKCKDTAGNAADPLTRTVIVKDTTCPTCKINGVAKVTREASFPYSDLGAVCTDNIDGARTTKTLGTFNVEKVGTYKLTYTAKDKSNNEIGQKKCKNLYFRTIIVKDTLKPVISLHFKGATIHKSKAIDTGVNAQKNPAADAANNPYFMEESQTSVNGWVIGAIASAVTGVALLGFSMKKSTVATSVPV
jgi:hypothetical protein